MFRTLKEQWPLGVAFLVLVVATLFADDPRQLWGGFIGAVVGAWATIHSTQAAIGEAASSERALRIEEEKSRLQSAVAALKIEVGINLRIITTQTDAKLVSFASDSWAAMKPNFHHLDPNVAEALTQAYCAVQIHAQAQKVELKRGSAGPDFLANNIKAMRDGFERASSVPNWVRDA